MPSNKNKFKENLNIVFGTLIFILLIGSAFAIDWIFGVGFIIGFVLAVYNRILEKNFLIPVFIFVGALIVRYAIYILLPHVLNNKASSIQDFVSLGISVILFVIIIFIGYRIKKGRWKLWKKRFWKVKKPRIKKPKF